MFQKITLRRSHLCSNGSPANNSPRAITMQEQIDQQKILFQREIQG
jgi:hypothetical protein